MFCFDLDYCFLTDTLHYTNHIILFLSLIRKLWSKSSNFMMKFFDAILISLMIEDQKVWNSKKTKKMKLWCTSESKIFLTIGTYMHVFFVDTSYIPIITHTIHILNVCKLYTKRNEQSNE